MYDVYTVFVHVPDEGVQGGQVIGIPLPELSIGNTKFAGLRNKEGAGDMA